jgi:glycosyltransferase involved in cell wall biosynthesis
VPDCRHPRVAVVIPCFNDGPLLREALASLQEQEPCEVVVVDDGSTEAVTRGVLAEIQADGLQVVRQENSGPSAARMAGLNATTARFIVPLDADDMIEPGAIQELADALEADPDRWVAWGDVRTFGETTIHVRSPRALDPWLLTYVNLMPIVAMYRRVALEHAGGWALKRYEDWDLWMTAAEQGWHTVYIDRIVERSRLHGPRKRRRDFASHVEAASLLERRHRSLFASRAQARRRSAAAWWVKIALPTIERLPGISSPTKHRLYNVVCLPGYLFVLLGRRARRWFRASGVIRCP